MRKKMKFPFLFKPSETSASASTSAAALWPWPACVNNPKTLSFRADANGNIYKTMNSAYLDDDKNNNTEFTESTPDSFFSIRDTFEHHDDEICGNNPEQTVNDESAAAVIRGLRSDRLFFQPGETSSILEEAKVFDFPYKESAEITAMDSRDPFHDFRVSMEEMVEAHGLKDWESLEELLTCYLRVNGKSNHGYIVGAFVDLLLRLALASASASTSNASSSSISAINDEHCSSSSTTTQYSFTSPLSFSSSTYSSNSPCLSLLENEDEIVVVEKNV